MKNLIILFLAGCFFILQFSAQETTEDDRPYFILECRAVDNKGEVMADVGRYVYESDSLIDYSISDSIGKFEDLGLYYNYRFIVTFKKEKFISKSIVVNAQLETALDSITDLSIFPFDVTMLKSKKRKDYSIITDKPVAAIIVNEETGKLDYDRVYIARRKKEIETFYNKKK